MYFSDRGTETGNVAVLCHSREQFYNHIYTKWLADKYGIRQRYLKTS